MTEDEIVGLYHRLDGHEFEQAPGDGEGQVSLVCCSPQGSKEQDKADRLNNNNMQFSKESSCNTGAPGLIPGSGRSPGEGNGNPLQYSCLENYMDRGSQWGTVCGVIKSQIQLSDQHTHINFQATDRYEKKIVTYILFGLNFIILDSINPYKNFKSSSFCQCVATTLQTNMDKFSPFLLT